MKELSLCKYCNCMTKTIQKETLSASENKHYAYYCGKCGIIKPIVEDMLKRRKTIC